jgi:hypothetical protein
MKLEGNLNMIILPVFNWSSRSASGFLYSQPEYCCRLTSPSWSWLATRSLWQLAVGKLAVMHDGQSRWELLFVSVGGPGAMIRSSIVLDTSFSTSKFEVDTSAVHDISYRQRFCRLLSINYLISYCTCSRRWTRENWQDVYPLSQLSLLLVCFCRRKMEHSYLFLSCLKR